jgi:hypothetical protein
LRADNHTLYFDKTSGLLLGAVHKVKTPDSKEEVPQRVVFGDYQEKGGLKQPRRVTVYQGGKKVLEGRVSKVDFPEKLDDKLVERP